MLARVVFGIGNPGYDGTRHNLGFDVIDVLSRRVGRPLRPLPKLKSEGAEVVLAGERVALLKPLTYVNRCGPVLQAVRRHLRLPTERLMVVVDDLDLPVGRVRLRAKGGDGGHNGLRSIMAHLAAVEFPRVRIGIGRGPGATEDYVLQRIPAEERAALEAAVERAADAVEAWIRLGVERAMGEVNRRDLDPGADRP